MTFIFACPPITSRAPDSSSLYMFNILAVPTVKRGVELELRRKFVINYHLESDRRAYMCGLMYTMFDIQLTIPFFPREISLSSEQEL